MDRETLADLAVKYQGNWKKIAYDVIKDVSGPHRTIKDQYITIMDPDYPEALRQLQCPPWVLFYQGDISLLKKPMITIVGSRKLTPYGMAVTREASALLSKKYVIVSGLAAGADGTAHRAALEHGHTVGVCGHGLKIQYPKENADLYARMKKTDLILSEFPYDTPIARENFPWRNRILAALGEKIIVTQAAVKSGTMHTVNEALDLGREVWCVPYPYDDPNGRGCDLMIQEGAQILYSREQIADLVE